MRCLLKGVARAWEMVGGWVCHHRIRKLSDRGWIHHGPWVGGQP